MITTQLEFKTLEVSDKNWVDKLLQKSDFRGSEFCFGNNFIWQHIYHTKFSRYKDFYLQYNTEEKRFAFPAGDGDLREVIGVMTEYLNNQNAPLRMFVSHTSNKEKLEALFPGRFVFEEIRDSF